MGKVLIRFVSLRFDVEEGTLWLFDFIDVGPKERDVECSTFSLRSNLVEIETDSPGQLQGSLIDIVLRRTDDGTLRRINLCLLREEITEATIYGGQFCIDLTRYKEVVLRVRGNQSPDSDRMFNVSMLESAGPTFDLAMNESGESALLASPGRYFVSAVVGGKAIRERFEISADEAEPRIVEFGPF